MNQNHILSHMLTGIVRDFGQPVMIWQAGTLIAVLVVAWLVARFLRGRLEVHRRARHEALRFSAESLDKALFPLLGSALVWFAQALLDDYMSTSLLDLALVPLFGIALIYVVFYIARRVFSSGGRDHAGLFVAEKIVTVLVWIGMAMTVLGIQDQVLRWMASVRFRVANERMTLLSLSTGLLWVCVTMIVAMWLGSLFEERVMRSRSIDANLKVVLARVGRALLMLAAVLISFSLVGIDITVLGVFGGALGVGLGFGLQKIASNYVSGFIILIDRSIRIGDSINVGGLQGVVTEIRTRFTTVRGLDGIETLIPNEKLMTDVVQNHSSYLTRGYAKAAVQISYDSDVDRAMALLAQAAQGVERILDDPAPTPYLVSFGADGIDLELGFWIENAAKGTAAVRSSVNRNIWRLFNEHGIAIPYPTRDVRIIGEMPGPRAVADSSVGAFMDAEVGDVVKLDGHLLSDPG
ncbi:MAG TPA: mechanosensitive ion channel domain-containing protein [Trinickia sp.]|jgi:small-conductance mechanosensitive channel|uniref:mechanosensitive ion channel family protein n=1 Tax=Trinickia sp. TaxID=2571163 RepID=UPI002CA3486B|nr:mechanosensitive ion channel domain-containing protein [Trinickia sp.]HTI16774.1 mechanosensitive ion channel domain-containing protein [Trinickia sp.]